MKEATQSQPLNRIVVAITGSSGSILGVRLLELLKPLEIETHLVISRAAAQTLVYETGRTVADVRALSGASYNVDDIGAAIASGSFKTMGMIVVPCSMKTLSAVANSYADNLIARAADVTLKEGRPLVLVVRETPLHRGHIRLMDLAAKAGAILFPPVPAFYHRPQTIEEMIDQVVSRVLARIGIETGHFPAWKGLQPSDTNNVSGNADV
jgi:4-hydroxy-3-polyprenylbenzoate decarboxylase